MNLTSPPEYPHETELSKDEQWAEAMRLAVAENGRLKGIIRNLLEVIWEHHSSDVMTADVCPVCIGNKQFRWALGEADKVLRNEPAKD